MKKYFKPLLTSFIVLGFVIFSFLFHCNITVSAGGEEIDTQIASIGFEVVNIDSSDNPNLYIAEKNNAEQTIKVCISQAQDVDVIFSLTENIVIPQFSNSPSYYENIENEPNFQELINEWEDYWQQVFINQGNIFEYNSTYTLPAGQTTVNIVLTQNSNAESVDDIRVREITLSTTSQEVQAGYEPTTNGLRSILDVVVYDLNGNNSIIIVPDNSDSIETIGYRNFKIIRTGDNGLKTTAPSFQYKLINYDINNNKELKFETTQSNYIFKIVEGKYETEANLKLKFFDNNYLNWQSVYTLQFSNFENCGTQYFNSNTLSLKDFDNNLKTSFFIEDDELSLINNDAMIVLNLPQTNPYIRPEENYDAVLPEEGGVLSYEIYTRPSTGKSVSAFRLFYTIDFEKTSAVLGTDFNLDENYSIVQNVGYIDFNDSEVNEDSIGILNIEALNNNLLDGAKTLHVQFFLSDENTNILLPAKDFLSLAIWDDEYLAENNTISWANSMAYSGADIIDGVVSFNSSYSDCLINLNTDYYGNLNYSIPIQYNDITTQVGVDYNKTSYFDNLTLFNYETETFVYDIWGTNLNVLNNGLFYGTKRLQVTILEDYLPEGFSLNGPASIFIDLVGDYEKDYLFTDISSINVNRDEDITFTVYRSETTAYTNYIDLQNSSLVEGEHYQNDLFPFAVNWEEGQTEQTISIPLLDFSSLTTDFYGDLVFLNSQQNDFNKSFVNQYTSVNLTLINSFERGKFYFGLSEYTYLTSLGSLVVEVMRTSNVGVASINYSLVALTGLTENEMAVIGIDINDTHGTLTFNDGEFLKTINITIPTITRKILNRKIGLKLSEPSRYSSISQEQTILIINDDTWPTIFLSKETLSYTDLNGTNPNCLRFYPVTDKRNKAYFNVGITSSSLPIDVYTINFNMYAVSDASLQGIEVWIDNQKLSPTLLAEPYTYLDITYYYSYNYTALLNKDNNYFVITLNYENIYDILPVFAGNMFCVTANSQTIEESLTNVTISAEKSTANMPTISMALDEDTIGNNDSIAVTISRTWENIYLRQSVRLVASGGLMYLGEPLMYEPLDTIITFEPFEEKKVIMFYSKTGYTIYDEQPILSLYDANDNLIAERDVTVLSDVTSSFIKLEAIKIGNNNYTKIGLEKTLQVLFKLSRTWNEEITITMTGLHPALSTTQIVFPVGVKEVVHDFHVDGLLLTENINNISYNLSNFPTEVNGKPLIVNCSEVGWSFYSDLYNIGLPNISFHTLDIFENQQTFLTVEYNPGETPISSLSEKLIYCDLTGTAELGKDYVIDNAIGNPGRYNSSLNAFIIPAGRNIINYYVKSFNDLRLESFKTIVFTFYELSPDGTKFAQRTYTVNIHNIDSYGKISITKQATESGYDLLVTNANNTGMGMSIGLKLNDSTAVMGVDYTITNYDSIDEVNNIVYVYFDGSNQTKTLHINYFTNNRCVLSFQVLEYPSSNIEILTNKIDIILMPTISTEVIDEIANNETTFVSGLGQEANYYFCYNEIYSKYTNGNTSFVANRVDIYNNGNIYDVIYTYKTIYNSVVTTVKVSYGTYTSNEFIIPSKVNAKNWTDINGDGIKEMCYASCYPYSFYGGMTECEDFGKYGVFYIDFINNLEGSILVLSQAEVLNKYIEINFIDLTCDGKNEITIFIQNSAFSKDKYNYTLGDNSFYIISNTSQTDFNLEIVYFESGSRIINNNNMRLVFVNYYNYDYEVPHIVLRYLKPSDFNINNNKLNENYTSVAISLYGHDKYKNIFINNISTIVNENEYLTFNVYNTSGSAGTFTITYTGITAVAIRDFALSGTVTYIFRQGEYNKEISLLIVDNYLPNDDLTFKITIGSNDFYLGSRTENIITIKDKTIINKSIIFTIQDNFNVDKNVTDSSLYESTYTYITGNNALFSVRSLILNGLSAFNTDRYFPKISATFNGTTVTDTDNKGYINFTNLLALASGLDGIIRVRVDFMAKNGESITSTILSTISFDIPYYNHETREAENTITTDNQISVGQKARITIRSSFDGSLTNAHKIRVTYFNSVNNSTQTFNSDEKGISDFQVDGGNLSKVYSNTITVRNITTGEEESYEHILSVYGEKIEATIITTNDINASLISSVKIKVVGQDVNFTAEGVTNSNTGRFNIKLIPFKTYKIYYNEGNAITYLNEGVYTLTNATFENTVITLNLTLRNNNTQINNVQVYVQSKSQVISMVCGSIGEYFTKGGASPINGMAMADVIYSYLNGTLHRQLNANEQIMLKSYFEYTAGYTSSRTSIAGFKYAIGNDIFLGSPDLKIYKTLAKETEDVVIFSYDYYPVYSNATITLKSSGVALNSTNAAILNYNVTNYYGQTCQRNFIARTGIEDNLIDMEIVSNAYSSGKKVVQFVAFGDGLGRMLAAGINEGLSQIQTAEIPSWVKFLDGMSFALSFTDKELGFQIDEEEMTISIYIGISKTIFERSHGASYANQDTPSLSELRGAKNGGVLSSGRGGFGFGIGLGGKMHFKYVDDSWRLLAGEIYVSVSASYNYTKYFLIPVVNFPAFFSATVSLTMTNTVMFDWNAAECKTDVTGQVAFELALEIEIGLGIRGVFSASVFGQGSIEVIIQYHTGGAKLTLSVCGGVRLQIIFWKYEYIFAETQWSTQSDGYVERNLQNNVYMTQLKNLVPSTSYEGVAQVMNSDSEVIMEMALNEACEVEDVVVVENIFESAAPQMAELSDGTKMIAWINQDSNRGVNNSELINYIYYNGEEWSDVQVLDSTITADLYFDLKTFENTFAISYSEVKKSLGSGSTLSERLQLSEIAFSIFDKNTMTFSKTRLTDNIYNDRIVMFEMTGDTGIMVVYQSQNNNINDEMTLNEFLCGENANNRLLYSIYSQGVWGEFKTLQTSIPAIVNLSLKIVNNIAYIAIETDNDNDFDTTNDREILLIQYIFANNVIALESITDNSIADTDPILASFNNKIVLVFKSEDKIVCYYNNKFSSITVLPAGQSIFSFYSNDNYAVLLWSAAVEGKTQIFASIMTANTNVFSAPYQITTGDNNKSNAFATMNNGNLFVYYCEDIYEAIGTDGNFRVTRNIKITAVDLFSDLEIEVLDIDTSKFLPNSTQKVKVRIYNNGNIAVENPTVTAQIGGRNETFIVNSIIAGLSYVDYEIDIIMPETKTNVIFSVEKEDLIESDYENNTDSIDLMKVDLAVSGFIITRTTSGLKIEITIENKSFVNANNIVLSLTKYSDISIVFDSLNILSLPANSKRTYVINIENDDIIYSSNQVFWSKIFVLTPDKTIYTVEEDDYNSENNVKSLSIKRAQLEGEETLAVMNENINLFTNQSSLLNYMYTGTGTLNITSSNSLVVSVIDNQITGVASGSATITLTDGSASKTINVTVSENTYSISLNGNSNEYILQGQSFIESGANCFYNGEQTTDVVRITNTMDTDIIGTYQIIYEYVIDNIVVATASRTVYVRPQKACATISAGIISGYALTNSTVVLFDSNNNEVARTIAQNGQFTFAELTNSDQYNLVVLVEGVESEAVSFTINMPSNNMSNIEFIIMICCILATLVGASLTILTLIKKRK